MEKIKLEQRLIENGIQEPLLESSLSLRERFQEKKKIEVKIERKTAITLQKIWRIILNGTAGVFALIGLCSLLHPVLRSWIFTIFAQFIREIGIL